MYFIEAEKSVREYTWTMQNLHSHPHYEIYYLAKGSRNFFLSNALYHLTAPVLIVIPPHAVHMTEGDAFMRYNINVAKNYLDDYQTNILEKTALKIIKPDEKQHEELIKLLENLVQTDKKQKFGETVTHTLFSYFVFLINQMSETVVNHAPSDKTKLPRLVLQLIDFINQNYADRLTLEDLAQRFFVSKTTLIYNFKKHMNCSPIDFLLNVRLNKAKEMLLHTKKSIGEVSEACGFSSANYFGLIFKQKEGLSPANYRKHEQTKV
jgi:AraC-like DNA-binding protein